LEKRVKTSAVESDTSESARRRLLSIRGEPLFYASWDNALFIHYETDPEILRRSIPYELDLYDGRAFVSLVAFKLRDMRPRFAGPVGALLMKPIATHNFLNIRTHVRHRGEPAIYFMREWVANRLSVLFGPSTFGLPYRYGEIDYRDGGLHGNIRAREGSLVYRAQPSEKNFAVSESGSLTAFLLERYTAFTQTGATKRFFRIWHEPWRQVSARIEIIADDLLESSGDWWRSAERVAANYSPGVDVWMGWPQRIENRIL
jgi:uncharacterized protein YqjF (DUF2071 family)